MWCRCTYPALNTHSTDISSHYSYLEFYFLYENSDCRVKRRKGAEGGDNHMLRKSDTT